MRRLLLLLPHLLAVSTAPASSTGSPKGKVYPLNGTTVNAAIGKELTLSCMFTGIEPEDDYIFWKKGDNVLFVGDHSPDDYSAATHEITESGPNSRISNLKIFALQPNDDAVFNCGYENSDEKVFKSIKVNVLVPPNIEISPSHNPYRVLAGESVTLNCRTREANPVPTIKWSKEGGSLPSSAVHDFNTLRLSAVKRTDSGVYKCKATNKVGEATSTIEMIVDGGEEEPEVKKEDLTTAKDDKVTEQPGAAPWIKTEATFQAVKLNTNVKIACNYDGYPEPTILWSFNGNQINVGDNRVKQFARRLANVSQSILEVSDITAEFFGDYSCKASNQYGSETAAIHVSGQPGALKLKVDKTTVSWSVISAYDITKYRVYYRLPDTDGWDEKVDIDAKSGDKQSETEWRGSLDLATRLSAGRYEVQVQASNEQLGWGTSWADSYVVVDISGEAADDATQSASGSDNGSSTLVTASSTLTTLLLFLFIQA